jgi:hypothetical protein
MCRDSIEMMLSLLQAVVKVCRVLPRGISGAHASRSKVSQVDSLSLLLWGLNADSN